MSQFTVTPLETSHGWTDVAGIKTSGISCDIRGKGTDQLDLALFYSEAPCKAAGVFTRNAIQAAPVRVCQRLLIAKNKFHAIVANSGNANCATGEQGLPDALEMQRLAAEQLGLLPEQVFVASTGRIGRPMPMPKVRQGITDAVAQLAHTPEQGDAAADAILTSDTRRKVCTVEVQTDAGTYRIAGVAKGAGMIEPNMATMLAFIVTDADVTRSVLKSSLQETTDVSFNSITVDGDMSTNDTVLLLANGASGVRVQRSQKHAVAAFQAGLEYVCRKLAEKIVGDGEKITKVVNLHIEGARTRRDAEKVARAIGNSLLVKSSWYGQDPNWGRLLDAAGYAGVQLSEETIDIAYQAAPDLETIWPFLQGEPDEAAIPACRKIVQQKQFHIRIRLNQGPAHYTLLSTDLTEGYVRYNMSE